MTGAGADVFVSYNRDDSSTVCGIVAALESRGIAAHFDERIPAGVSWQAELRAAIVRARTILVMLGKRGLGPWQGAEVEIAIDLAVHDAKRRIVPVLLPGASPEILQEQLFLARYEWVDLRGGATAAGIERLVADLRDDGPRPPRQSSTPTARTPTPSISASHGSVAAGTIANSIVIVGSDTAVKDDD